MTGNLLDDFNRPTVPQAWTDLQAARHEAAQARGPMQDMSLPQPVRDAATADYVRAVDRAMALLDAMHADHTLGRITNLLARKDRK